jgi:alkanesulfonate monooxygenase SsuD/methylene tetrahydromethanopterin reductase-like flavin-dependent oxidoreductase (luciferase family)
VEIYKNTIDQAEPVGEYVNNNVMITSQMLCLNDGQKAREISCDMNGSYQNSLVFHYLDTFPKPPFVPDWPELIPEPTLEEMEQRIQAGRVVVGTPEECEKAVQGYVDTGADQLVFGQLSSTMPIDVAVESIETFGRELIPVFDKDPVHSTQRQREVYVSARGPLVNPIGRAHDKVPV